MFSFFERKRAQTGQTLSSEQSKKEVSIGKNELLVKMPVNVNKTTVQAQNPFIENYFLIQNITFELSDYYCYIEGKNVFCQGFFRLTYRNSGIAIAKQVSDISAILDTLRQMERDAQERMFSQDSSLSL